MSKQPPAELTPLGALSEEQCEQLDAYRRQLIRFNHRINLISREDEAHIARHIRHVLTLAWKEFPRGSTVIDWGTGGGLPAIPLAIRFPGVQVYAIDAVGKKIQAVRVMARRLGLENLYAWHGRAEEWSGRAQYSVSRATASIEQLWRWHRRVAEPGEHAENVEWSPGLLCLKGGDLSEEMAEQGQAFPDVEVTRHALEPLLKEAYFAEKYLLEVR